MRAVLNNSKAVVKKSQNNTRTIRNIGIILLRILLYVFLIMLAFICVFPFYIMLINATRSNSDIITLFCILPGCEFFRMSLGTLKDKLVPIFLLIITFS